MYTCLTVGLNMVKNDESLDSPSKILSENHAFGCKTNNKNQIQSNNTVFQSGPFHKNVRERVGRDLYIPTTKNHFSDNFAKWLYMHTEKKTHDTSFLPSHTHFNGIAFTYIVTF